MATGSTPGVELYDITADQTSAAIQSAVIQTPKAAAPLALSGDTQLSRQQLIQPLQTATTFSVLGNGGGGATPSGTSWNAATFNTGGGTLRVGLTNQSIMRWELNLPANYSDSKFKMNRDAARVEKVGSNYTRSVLSESGVVDSGGDLEVPGIEPGKKIALGGSVLEQATSEVNFGEVSKVTH
jgi:hypothetical protein